ncbi:MAG TPA: MscL family protein [Acidimicrobiales bacterium]|nr:MscL family protein [Acidimicrobiales bacterium]
MSEKKSALSEFKDFVMQGNVIDLAVAVIIAQFFGAIIKDLVNLILTLFAVPGSQTRDFNSLTFKIGHGIFHYGQLISDLITFVLVASVVFFAVVRPVRRLLERRRATPDPESTDRPCPQCLSEIPKAATRCAFCTAEVGAAA